MEIQSKQIFVIYHKRQITFENRTLPVPRIPFMCVVCMMYIAICTLSLEVRHNFCADSKMLHRFSW